MSSGIHRARLQPHRTMRPAAPLEAMLTSKWSAARLLVLTACLVVAASGSTYAQGSAKFEPVPGQPGRDVVWVPTPYELVETMLDMAKVTPDDFVMDLGSGDGRNVIAAAKRGASALGVEYNPDMVALSRRLASEQGVADKATFVEGDMFEADVSKATVLALFLLPDNLSRLRSKFLDMRPGARIVANTFGLDNWQADDTRKSDGPCTSWCTALLYIVPAKVEGRWRMPQGELTLRQDAQLATGTLTSSNGAVPVLDGRLRGDEIRFTAGDVEYSGRVKGDVIEGTTGGSAWRATRVR